MKLSWNEINLAGKFFSNSELWFIVQRSSRYYEKCIGRFLVGYSSYIGVEKLDSYVKTNKLVMIGGRSGYKVLILDHGWPYY